MDYSDHGLNTYKFTRDVGASPVKITVYNRSGNFVTGYSQCYGPFKKLNILDSYPPRVIDHLPNNDSLQLIDELMLLGTDNKMKEELQASFVNSDYILIVYWAIWAGYYNDIVLKHVTKYYKTYKDSENILVVLVNVATD